MTFKTNPEILKPLPRYSLTIPIKNTIFFRQSYLIYLYIKSYLFQKSFNIVQYTSQTNFKFSFIWLTFYKSTVPTNFNSLLKVKKKKLKSLPYKLKKKKINLQNFLLSHTKQHLYKTLKNKSGLSTYFYTTKTHMKKATPIKLKITLKKKPSRIEKKMQNILKDRLLTFKLFNYILQFFKISVEIYVKNIKSYIKNSARRLNKKLFKELFFYKKFFFLKDTLYLVNICTYCQAPKILSEYVATTLCKLRKQWPFINVTTTIIKKILKVRVNIRGFKLLISGRLQGRNRKKTFVKLFGKLPTQTFSANIKYAFSFDYNIFGTFGVRVWLYPL